MVVVGGARRQSDGISGKRAILYILDNPWYQPLMYQPLLPRANYGELTKTSLQSLLYLQIILSLSTYIESHTREAS